VLLVTAWENYVEQLLLEAVDHITPIIAADADPLSTFLRKAVATKAKVEGTTWTRQRDADGRGGRKSGPGARDGVIPAACHPHQRNCP
jgi:hypothetical protein